MSDIVAGVVPEPGRRLFSTLPNEPGYDNWRHAHAAGLVVRVYLDGERLDKVLAADEARGRVVQDVYEQRIVDGRLKTFKTRIERCGQVRITMDPA